MPFTFVSSDNLPVTHTDLVALIRLSLEHKPFFLVWHTPVSSSISTRT